MSITAITIENFKGIKDPVRIELKPITLLFGPNSAGKSTIIQALHYAREIFERGNCDPDKTISGGEAVVLGGFKNLVHNHEMNQNISFKIDIDITKEELPGYVDINDIYLDKLDFEHFLDEEMLNALNRATSAGVKLDIGWSEILGKPYIEQYSTFINGQLLAAISSTPDGRQVFISTINPVNPVFWDDHFSEGGRKLQVKYIEKKLFDCGEDYNFEEDYIDLEEEDDFYEHSPMLKILTRINQEAYSGNIQSTRIDINNSSALPLWGEPLDINSFFENKEWEPEVIQLLTHILSSLITGPGELVKEQLSRLCYLGPLREIPSRNHEPERSPNNTRWPNGIAAYDALFFCDTNLVTKTNEWLSRKDKLNSGYDIEVKKFRELEDSNPLMLAALQNRMLDEDLDLRNLLLSLPVKRRLLFRDKNTNIELAPQDIGVGISQVLPVVVAALNAKTGFVAIEQPELHIHPAFQVALGDLFIEQIQERPDLTFILETHSEHLMLRFLRRIRETTEGELGEGIAPLSKDQVAVFYVLHGETGTEIKHIPIDEEGEFTQPWPQGFFAERARELF